MRRAIAPRHTPEPPDGSGADAPSKTRRKKDMAAVQDLGEALVGLEAQRLAALGLPERLIDAIRAARNITKHEARRRQMQFIGRLMREVDPEPIRAALSAVERIPRVERARFAAAEDWRDRLMSEPDALQAFLAAQPLCDAALLRDLVDKARAERARGGPPHKYRALFRFISSTLAEPSHHGTEEEDTP